MVWLGLLSYGLRERFLYATTPGLSQTAPRQFPASSRLPRAGAQSALFMFVHPECPCTRASLHELSGLLTQGTPSVSPVLVIMGQLGDGGWEHTALAEIARNIPGLRSFIDRDAAEAARFGAETSGHVVLYDAQGRLQFAGGITSSRGHVGDNVGLRSLQRLLQHSATAPAQHAVFGCPLSEGGAR
jgi:hypothetical protein